MKPLGDIDDLIQRDVDGRLSEEEQATLVSLMERDPAAREEHRRLIGLRDLLADVPKVDPPAHLTAKVLREIRVRRASDGAHGFWPRGRFALGYLYAAAAGAAVALLSVQVLGPGPSPGNSAATIGGPAGAASARGWLSYRAARGKWAVDVLPPGKGAQEVTLAYDPASFELLGISNETGAIDQIDAAGGRIRWSQERPARVTVLLAPRSAAGARVDVRYAGEGGQAGNGSVELPGID